ncbi:protein translocase subunit SecF [Luteitalea sp. TBR-22]|uniref:protein translocase subunit SecF n=1 Tax=Luteitalea sp. TBR-22 TaxID=2802971 RepID=UPI001AFAF0E9|nr:protein translocase subunit SecF [Luteitalea sp. TBR-22]BCS35584.1 protein translocase subunit SecF [Luteitalea sp. TBR-22]
MDLFSNANYNFTKWRWHAIAFSALIVVLGLVQIARNGLPLGIDFSGGTIVVLKFQQPTSEEVVRKALDRIPGEKVVQQYGAASANEVLIRLPQAQATEQGTSLEQGARQVVDAVRAANIGAFEPISTEIVGPVIGKDLQRKGVYATLASILGITLYIAFRFRLSFAVGAIAATLHDVIVTLAVLTFFGYELSLNIIAAILTITGYSVNDTIVIFDRVRENFRTMRGASLESQVNTAVNQTLSRTIITAGTTFLSVLALYIFGGEVLEGFAFTMLVGIISGTYSTVFIASAIAIMLSKNETTPVAPAAPARAAGDRPRRRERRNA